MTIIVEVVDTKVLEQDLDDIFDYFTYIDQKFSTYKENSEISQINQGKLAKKNWSHEMKLIFKLSENTKKETAGYFNIYFNHKYDPSGIVKGWAIHKASKLLEKKGFHNFYVSAGGDIQVKGVNNRGKSWQIGLKNPFDTKALVKVLQLTDKGFATSGVYIRGQHIYNPHLPGKKIDKIISLSVIGPNIYEADRFATAAFAMDEKGIEFIEQLSGYEGYMINRDGIATYTSGFNNYLLKR